MAGLQRAQLNSSLALLQDELYQIKPDTPLLDRSAKDLQDLIFPEGLGDNVDLARLAALSPLSLDGFMDESLEWSAEHDVDAVSDANAELFRALDLEFKQIMLLDGNSATGDTPLSNTPTDTLVSPHAGANGDEATPTTTTSRRRPVRRVVSCPLLLLIQIVSCSSRNVLDVVVDLLGTGPELA